MAHRYDWLTATLMPSALVAQESRSQQVPNQARERTLAAVTSEGDSLTEEQESIAADLQRRLPVGSEGRLMLDAILSGERMGPNDGWFAVAQPRTRFELAELLERYDSNDDRVIDAEEFPGDAGDFSIVDRNGDRVVNEADLAWEATRGSNEFGQLLSRLDTERDGTITREEFEQLWTELSGKNEQVSAEELRRVLFPAERVQRERRREPSRGTLLLGLARQEIGSWNPGPELNDEAIDFELATIDGERIRLSDHLGDKPVVLIFGNYTCGPFRGQAGNLHQIHERFKDRATFLMVYVREAHPEDGWKLPSNALNEVAVLQPTNFGERREVAEVCHRHFHAEIPMMVDSIDDEVGHAYSGGPARLYLLDRDGTIAFKSGRGPHYFFPSQLESALVWLLNSQEPARGEDGAEDSE
ncbi:MAG: deiodinase family protein [Pirellulaceae bacterium]